MWFGHGCGSYGRLKVEFFTISGWNVESKYEDFCWEYYFSEYFWRNTVKPRKSSALAKDSPAHCRFPMPNGTTLLKCSWKRYFSQLINRLFWKILAVGQEIVNLGIFRTFFLISLITYFIHWQLLKDENCKKVTTCFSHFFWVLAPTIKAV